MISNSPELENVQFLTTAFNDICDIPVSINLITSSSQNWIIYDRNRDSECIAICNKLTQRTFEENEEIF